MASIFIVGAGWVGAPLSEHLAKHDNQAQMWRRLLKKALTLLATNVNSCEVFSFDAIQPERLIGQLYSLLLENNTGDSDW